MIYVYARTLSLANENLSAISLRLIHYAGLYSGSPALARSLFWLARSLVPSRSRSSFAGYLRRARAGTPLARPMRRDNDDDEDD